ncbi:MAG: hydrolase [Mycobacterium sp.]|jgi:ADP-ribose pyrophosphatase YjhB (NUDIX family)|nr:hydrolase [Mycobacterium sp.]
MSRIDYYDDPQAPPANSLVPAASAIVVDDLGRLLLHRRRDNDKWALPGGAMELGESLRECVVREVREETGFDVDVVGIVGTYSDPRHVFAYDDGEVRQEFSICFLCTIRGGTLEASEESHEVRFFEVTELDDLPMIPSIRLRIDDYRSGMGPAVR